MEYEVDGQTVTVPDDLVKEYAKEKGLFNEEFDSARTKGYKSAEAKWQAEKEELVGTYSRELENTKKMNSGKKDEQISALQEQISTLTESFNTAQNKAQELEIANKTETVKSDLATQLAGVNNDYDRKNMLRDAMDNFDVSTGQFKLQSGATGSVNEVVAEFKKALPDRFSSNQPSGPGINGGAVFELPPNATPEQKRAAEINDRLKKG